MNKILNKGLLLIALIVLLWGVNVVKSDFTSSDEAVHVQITKELHHSYSSSFDLRLNGQLCLSMPSLCYWLLTLVIPSDSLFINEWLIRLPSVIAGVLIILLVYLFGKEIWNTRTGFLATMILLSTPAFALNVPKATPFALLTLCLLIPSCIYMKAIKQEGRIKLWELSAFWLGLLLAFLISGLFNVFMVLLVIVVVSLWEKDWKTIKKFYPVWGILFLASIVIVWMIAFLILTERELLQWHFVKELLLGNNAVYSEKVTPLFYFYHLIAGHLLPWGLIFLISLYVLQIRNRRGDLSLTERKIFRFLNAWFFLYLIILSVLPVKSMLFLLPALAPIAFSTGWFWSEFIDEVLPKIKKVWTVAGSAAFLILVSLAGILVVNPRLLDIHTMISGSISSPDFLLMALGLLVAAVLVLLSLLNPAKNQIFVAVFALPFIIMALYLNIIIPKMNGALSPAPLNECIERNSRPFSVVGMWRDYHTPYQIYGTYFLKILETPSDLNEFMTGIESRLVVIPHKYWVQNREVFKDLLNRLNLKPLTQVTYKRDLFMLFKSNPNEDDSADTVIDAPVNLVVLGDMQTKSHKVARVVNQVENVHVKSPIQGILTTGDNITPKHNFSRDVMEQIVYPLHSLINLGIPLYATLGNHDVRYAEEEISYPLFNMRGRRFYSTSFGKDVVEVFFIDSNTMRNDEEQLRWLDRELGASRAQWKIVIGHEPLYASPVSHGPSFDLLEILEPVFLKNDVDIVLSGHNHIYERHLLQKGIMYITIGNSGKLHKGELPPCSTRAASYNERQSFLLLQFRDDRLIFRTYNIFGEVVDHGCLREIETEPSLQFHVPLASCFKNQKNELTGR